MTRVLLPFLVLGGLLTVAGCAEPEEEAAGEAGVEGTRGEAPGEASPAEMEAAIDGDSAHLVAAKLMEALGGQEAWERTRFLRFRWVVERDGQALRDRLHAWDRYTGRYRLEYEADGTRHLFLFNANEVDRDGDLGKVPEGRAWIGGAEISGSAADSALHQAYAAFINDSYWLLMPFKWTDPGVHLAYEGRRRLAPPPEPGSSGAAGAEDADDGGGAAAEQGPEEYHVVHLTFEPGLGVTNDEYWGFVDPRTWLMDAWQYHLQGQEEKGALIWWRDWRQVGPIRLAADRRWQEGGARIHFPLLEASEGVPEGVFDPPGGGTASTATGGTASVDGGGGGG